MSEVWQHANNPGVRTRPVIMQENNDSRRQSLNLSSVLLRVIIERAVQIVVVAAVVVQCYYNKLPAYKAKFQIP